MLQRHGMDGTPALAAPQPVVDARAVVLTQAVERRNLLVHQKLFETDRALLGRRPRDGRLRLKFVHCATHAVDPHAQRQQAVVRTNNAHAGYLGHAIVDKCYFAGRVAHTAHARFLQTCPPNAPFPRTGPFVSACYTYQGNGRRAASG